MINCIIRDREKRRAKRRRGSGNRRLKSIRETGRKGRARVRNIKMGRMFDGKAMRVVVRWRIGGDDMEVIGGVSGGKKGSEKRRRVRRERRTNKTDMERKREGKGEKGRD